MMSTTKYQWAFCTTSISPHQGRMKAALMRRVEKHPSCTSCYLSGYRETLELLGHTSCSPLLAHSTQRDTLSLGLGMGGKLVGIMLHGWIHAQVLLNYFFVL